MKLPFCLILSLVTSIYTTNASSAKRNELRLVLAFGQSNIGEGRNTQFSQLPGHEADKHQKYAASMRGGPVDLKWGNIRGVGGGRCGALVQFLRLRYERGESNWAGISYSRGGYSLERDWLSGKSLENEHLRKIKDAFGELLGYPKGHNKPIHLNLLYFHQGESDMGNLEFGRKWDRNFKQFIKRANASGITWEQMIIAKPSGPYLKRPGGMIVAESISEFARSSEKTALLDTTGISYDETDHFDNRGQIEIGNNLSYLWEGFSLQGLDILVVGDSISMGYTQQVGNILKDAGVRVRHIGENGTWSLNGVKQIDRWLKSKPDIVVFNFGLHDMTKTKGLDGPPRQSIEQYIANLEIILGKIKAAGTLPLWATITPIKKQAHRKPIDVLNYNIAAIKFMNSQGVDSVNLYSPMKPHLEKWSHDGTHFKPEGYQFLANLVASKIRDIAHKTRNLP